MEKEETRKETSEEKKIAGKNWIKKYGIKLLIILLISIAVSFLAEVVFNYKVLRLPREERGVRELALDSLYTEGFELQGGKLVLVQPAGMIRLEQNQSYVRNLDYSYSLDSDFTAVVRIYPDAAIDSAYLDAGDGNNRLLSCSEVVVGRAADHMDLIFPEGSQGIEITGIAFDNSFHLSERRMLATATLCGLVLFILVFLNLVEQRLEYAFLVVGIVTCFTMIFTFPAQKVSWDEAWHFSRCYQLGIGTKLISTQEIAYYGDDSAVSSLLYPKSEDEFNNLDEALNQSDIYGKDTTKSHPIPSDFRSLNDIGHIPGAIGIGFAKLLHLPFSLVYRFGKLFNALFYIGITFFGIRRAKLGKRILTVVALMPTPLFLASSYSYDATLNAFAFLGVSYILSELAEQETTITWGRYAVFVVSIFIASAIKMVYAPLLLLLLLLPEKKFRSDESRYVMKFGILLVCAILLAVMLLPTLLSPANVEADARGGETSTSGQLAVIFGNPIGYAKLLILQIVTYAVDFTIGNGIYGTFAHYGYFPFGGFITVLCTFVILTDTVEFKLQRKHRLLIAGVVFLITCFIWTSMYISFTPVGADTINGVQGRYFIPIILPLLLLFQTGKIENHIPNRIYNAVILAAPMLFSYTVILYKVVVNCS